VKLDMVPSDQKPETQLDGIFGGAVNEQRQRSESKAWSLAR